MTTAHRWRARLRRPALVLAAAGALVASSSMAWSRERLHRRAPSHATTVSPDLVQRAEHQPVTHRHGSVSRLSLPSGDRDGSLRSAWVYRPAVPDSSDLPVLYFLHGHPGNSEDLSRAGVVDRLDRWASGEGRPFVLVSPDGNSAADADTEWADSADGSLRLESFVVDTLIPAVEGNHPRDARHRAIAGLSMGGYGAVNLTLHHPKTFGQTVSVAGYYVVDDPDGVGSDDPQWIHTNDPGTNVAGAAGLRFLFLRPDGEDNELMLGEDERFAPLLRAAGAAVAETLETPGHHGVDFVIDELPTVLRFLAAGWPADRSTMNRYRSSHGIVATGPSVGVGTGHRR